MATRDRDSCSSETTATGFALMLIAVVAGFSSVAGGFSLLLSFAGVLAGAILIFAGVRNRKVASADDDPTAPTGRHGVPGAAGVVRRWLRRNLAVVVLLLASSAATATAAAADGETNPVLCLYAFALLLIGISLLNVGLLLLPGDEDEQGH